MLPWNLLHYSVFLRRKHSLLRRARIYTWLQITWWIMFLLLTYLWQPGSFIITLHALFVLHLLICFLSVCGLACGRENHCTDTLVSPRAAFLPPLGSTFSRRSKHSSAPDRCPDPFQESTGSSLSSVLNAQGFYQQFSLPQGFTYHLSWYRVRKPRPISFPCSYSHNVSVHISDTKSSTCIFQVKGTISEEFPGGVT